MAVNEITCPSRTAAATALETVAANMPKGTQKDALLAIRDWVNENIAPDFTDETRARIQRIFEGTKNEQAGRAWVDREMSDPKYVQGTLAASGIDGGYHHLHKMIHEPEDGAELPCFWDANTKRWEPCELWPDVLPQTEYTPDNEG